MQTYKTSLTLPSIFPFIFKQIKKYLLLPVSQKQNNRSNLSISNGGV